MERDLTDDPRQPTAPGDAPTNPWTADEEASVRQWASQYFTSHQIPKDWGEPADMANYYFGLRKQGLSHADAMAKTPGGLGWDKYQAPPTTPPPNTNPGNGDPGGVPKGPLVDPYGQQFTPPPVLNIGGPAGVGVTPTFNGPNYTPPPAFSFNAPTADQAFNDPGYQFRLQQGHDQLQNWAAAKGTLNDSSTAKALEDYGQQAGSQEYQNLWNRDWQQQTGEYATNYASQFMDPYQIAYGKANAQNQNDLLGYSTNAAATQHANDTNYLNAFNLFNSNRDYYSSWQDRTFDKQFKVATS